MIKSGKRAKLSVNESRVLITGFGPFADFNQNPSEMLLFDLIRELDKTKYKLAILPVSYKRVNDWLKVNLNESFKLVVHFGLSAKNDEIKLETTAKNECGSQPDVDNVILDVVSVAELPKLETDLDLKKIKTLLSKEGIKAAISNDAGNYLCNYVYFKTLEKFHEMNEKKKSVFVHIPPAENLNSEDLKNFALKLLELLESQEV